MANISSLISSTSTTGSYSSKGLSGLASGMDTETLVEQMTASTRAKIAKQKQKKQLFQWKSDALRSITDKLITFSDKFISLTGSNSLYRESTFARNQITVNGANSGAVTVTGSSNTAGNVSIAAIEQLARDAQMTLNKASRGELRSGTVNTGDVTSTENHLAGKSFKITLPSGSDGRTTTYNVELKTGEGYSYDTVDEAIASINKSLRQVSVSGSGDSSMTLDSIINFSKNADGKIVVNSSNGGSLSGSAEVMNALGFSGESANLTSGSAISDSAMTEDTLKTTTTESFADSINGKSITFSYNGTTSRVTISLDPDTIASEGLEGALKKSLQEGLDRAFGSNRIKVGLETDSLGGSHLTFKTLDAETGGDDNTSVLKVVTGTASALSALGLKSGSSNRIDQTATLENSGMSDTAKTYLKNLAEKVMGMDPVQVSGMAVKDLFTAINNSPKANVTVNYMESADKLVLTSKEKGASGRALTDYVDSSGTSHSLFDGVSVTEGTDYIKQNGRDAIIHVKYEGSDEDVLLKRSTNTFDLDGLSVTANRTFGMTSAGTVDPSAEAITFDAKVNSEKIIDSIKEMVDAYNELASLTNGEMKAKYDREYPPLTDDQKKDMSEDEIKAWEEKAKVGVLSNDSDLSSLSSALRFIFSGSSISTKEMAEMGITVSDDWRENGKVTIDEDKLKAALETDPQKVSDLFAKEGGNGEKGGIMYRMKNVIEKYAGSEGILTKRAGATSKPSSLMDNSYLKQMDSIDEILDQLQDRLKTEQDRYQSQFTQLEQLISTMNSQSAYLSSMLG